MGFFVKWPGRGQRRGFMGKRSKTVEDVQKRAKNGLKHSKSCVKSAKTFEKWYETVEDIRKRSRIFDSWLVARPS